VNSWTITILFINKPKKFLTKSRKPNFIFEEKHPFHLIAPLSGLGAKCLLAVVMDNQNPALSRLL